MKTQALLSVLALTLGAGVSMVQAATPAAASGKSIVNITCKDYTAMDETVKPKFIYYALGHTRKGTPEAILDVLGSDKYKPELDQYCKLNLDKSAYEHVMKSSMASEKTNK